MKTQRERFAAGRLVAKRRELERLRRALDDARANYAARCDHGNEIAVVFAERDLEEFLAANPQLSQEAAC